MFREPLSRPLPAAASSAARAPASGGRQPGGRTAPCPPASCQSGTACRSASHCRTPLLAAATRRRRAAPPPAPPAAESARRRRAAGAARRCCRCPQMWGAVPASRPVPRCCLPAWRCCPPLAGPAGQVLAPRASPLGCCRRWELPAARQGGARARTRRYGRGRSRCRRGCARVGACPAPARPRPPASGCARHRSGCEQQQRKSMMKHVSAAAWGQVHRRPSKLFGLRCVAA